MNIIIPKKRVHSIEVPGMPLFFLAGPVRGGGDWQHKMCLHIHRLMRRPCCVAVPCRWEEHHRLSDRFYQGEDAFARQLDWERYYMRLAAQGAQPGCLIFWLATQKGPRPPEDGPYAQDTYGEVGRWSNEKKHVSQTRIVFGAEEGFPGLSQIRRNLNADLGEEVAFHETMEATIEAAFKEGELER